MVCGLLTTIALGELQARYGNYALACLVAIVGVVIARVVGRVLTRAVDSRKADHALGVRLGRVASFLIILIGLLSALQVAGVKITPLLGALGVGGLAVAIAAQEILSNFFAGVIIQVHRPFKVGDQIESLDHSGVVVDIDFRTTRIKTFDGVDVHLPNAEVLRHPIGNYTRTRSRRSELAMGVAYDTDLQRAHDVMLLALQDVDSVLAKPEPQVRCDEFADSSIVFRVLFWHEATEREELNAKHHVALALKEALDDAAIEIPFPQRVHWFPQGTGTAGSQGSSGS